MQIWGSWSIPAALCTQGRGGPSQGYRVMVAHAWCLRAFKLNVEGLEKKGCGSSHSDCTQGDTLLLCLSWTSINILTDGAGINRLEACTVTHMVIFAVSLVLLLQKVISMLVTMFLFFCKWNSTRLWWTEQEAKYVGVRAGTISWTYPCQKKASSTHSLVPPAERQTDMRKKLVPMLWEAQWAGLYSPLQRDRNFHYPLLQSWSHVAVLIQGCAHTNPLERALQRRCAGLLPFSSVSQTSWATAADSDGDGGL